MLNVKTIVLSHTSSLPDWSPRTGPPASDYVPLRSLLRLRSAQNSQASFHLASWGRPRKSQRWPNQRIWLPRIGHPALGCAHSHTRSCGWLHIQCVSWSLPSDAKLLTLIVLYSPYTNCLMNYETFLTYLHFLILESSCQLRQLSKYAIMYPRIFK